MENHLKLFLPLSLQDLGLRKVAALFCSNSDILKPLYRSLYYRLPTFELKQWSKATEKELKLGLPESLNRQVIDSIQAIGLKLRKWKVRDECQTYGWGDELPDTSKLCYTSTGAIDYKRLAEQYVHCDRLKEWQRYEMACCNCMENHIPLLWHELSEEEKREYEICLMAPDLANLWPYILEGEQSKVDYLWRESDRNLASFNQWIFEESAKRGNEVAAEYFFQKLTPDEREVSLMRTAHNVTDGSVLFYLLSLMTPEQQMEIVKARPVRVLICLLDWPRRHLLPENAALIWNFIEESDYGYLLFSMYSSLRHDNYFPKLFEEFFKDAPLDFIKRYFVCHESHICPRACPVLCILVFYEDSESIEVLFRHVDAASRVKLVLCKHVFGRFYDSILRGRWHVVVACLRHTSLTDEDRSTVKESFMRFLQQRVDGEQKERIFRSFFEFLNETDASDDEERKVKRIKLQ